MTKESRVRPAIRYSEAFKMQIVRELERGSINIEQIRRKYGIGGCSTIQRWASE
jgi:transposase-like protein